MAAKYGARQEQSCVKQLLHGKTDFVCMALPLREDGFVAAADRRGAMFLVDWRNNRFKQCLPPGSQITCLHFSRYETNVLFVGRSDGRLIRYNFWTHSLESQCSGTHRNGVLYIESTRRADIAVSASDDVVVAWSVGVSRVLFKRSLQSNTNSFAAACVQFEQDLLFTLDALGCFIVWKIRTKQALGLFQMPDFRPPPNWMPIAARPGPATVVALGVRGSDKFTVINVTQAEAAALSVALLPKGQRIRDMGYGPGGNLLVCTEAQCYVFDEDRVIAALDFSLYESAPFALKSFKLSATILGALSETGTVLLLDLATCFTRRQKSPKATRSTATALRLTRAGDEAADRKLPREQLDPAPTPHRLRSSLFLYGGYPAKYRKMVWKTLLTIPENKDAFRELTSRKLPSREAMQAVFPEDVSTDREKRREYKALINLITWNPRMVEIACVEKFVRPFVRVFGADQHSTFEVLATVLGNWAYPLLQSYPEAPHHLLFELAASLKTRDRELFESLESANCTRTVLWDLISTGFGSVLFPADWLLAWDHIMTQPISFYYEVAISLAVALRRSLMAAARAGQARAAVAVPRELDVLEVMRRAYSIAASSEGNLNTLGSMAFRPLSPVVSEYPPLFDFKAESSSCSNLQQVGRTTPLSLEKIRRDEEKLQQQECLVRELENQTIVLEGRLAGERWSSGADVPLDEPRLTTGRANVMESLALSRAEDLERLHNRARQEKLKHLKTMHEILNVQQESRQQRAKQRVERSLQQEQARRQAADRSYKEKLVDGRIRALTRELEIRLAKREAEDGHPPTQGDLPAAAVRRKLRTSNASTTTSSGDQSLDRTKTLLRQTSAGNRGTPFGFAGLQARPAATQWQDDQDETLLSSTDTSPPLEKRLAATAAGPQIPDGFLQGADSQSSRRSCLAGSSERETWTEKPDDAESEIAQLREGLLCRTTPSSVGAASATDSTSINASDILSSLRRKILGASCSRSTPSSTST